MRTDRPTIPQPYPATPGPGRRAALALVACLAVAACAGGHPPETAQQDGLIAPDLSFTMSDGARLPVRTWLPVQPKDGRCVGWRGVILALHGFTDSRDAWELPAPSFAAAGYAVYAPDQRGFGAAPGRGGWAGTGRLVQDAAELVARLRAMHPGLPVIVMGESMGGAVAAVLAATADAPQDATVLLSPAVWGWDHFDPVLAALLAGSNAVAPGWRPDPARAPVRVLASDNIAALIRMGRDPLTLSRPPIRSTKGLVDLMTDAEAAMPRLHGAVLILAGRRDQIVPQAATADAWAALPPGVRRGFYPDGFHLLPRDRARGLVIGDILSWLAAPGAWLPSGADSAAAAWTAGGPWRDGVAPWLPGAWLDGAGTEPAWPY